MRPGSLVIVVAATGFSVGFASGVRGEDAAVRPGSEVRVTAPGIEIPGIVAIVGQGVGTANAIVANTPKLVAVAVPGEEMPVALPRPGARPVGKLVAIEDDGVIVRFDGQRVPFRVPREAISRLEVNHGGHRNVLKSFGVGLGMGALIGVAIGLASGDDKQGLVAFSAGEKALIFGVGLGAIGGVVGFVSGIVERAPRWEPVELGKRHVGVFVEPRRNAGAGIGLRVAF